MKIDRRVELQRDKGKSKKDWYDLDADARSRGEQGGVYRIHAICGHNEERFLGILRLLKLDPNGRLYIGKANVFTQRFINLLKSLNPDLKGSGHDFAYAYMRLSAVSEAFPVETLRFTLRFSPTPYETEQEELQSYCQEFGELPPFNAVSRAGQSLT